MWPFKKKIKLEIGQPDQKEKANNATIADGIDWQQILSEGKSVELFDGCRAKCDGGIEDL